MYQDLALSSAPLQRKTKKVVPVFWGEHIPTSSGIHPFGMTGVSPDINAKL